MMQALIKTPVLPGRYGYSVLQKVREHDPDAKKQLKGRGWVFHYVVLITRQFAQFSQTTVKFPLRSKLRAIVVVILE